MWPQLKAMLLLKVVLLRHMTLKVVSIAFSILIIVFLTLFSLTAAVGLFFLGLNFPQHKMVSMLLGFTDIALISFLAFWFSGLLTELQRSDLIDFKKMLFLPVSLKMVFVLNFAFSMVSPIIFIVFFPTLGFILGLSFRFGPRMILSLSLILVFFLSLSAWTYYVRGMLSILLENKRRRRWLIALATFAFILMFQLPNLMNLFVFQRGSGRTREEIGQVKERVDPLIAQYKIENVLIVSNTAVPIGWLPLGMKALVERDGGTFMLSFVGLIALGIIPLTMGYRSTRDFYMGARKKPKIRSKRKMGAKITLLDRSLPFVDGEVNAVTFASLTSILRHPQIRIQLIMPVIMVIVSIVIFNLKDFHPDQFAWSLPLFSTALVVFPYFIFSGLFFNQFGIDPHGFQAYALSPVKRWRILLGKNLALIPIVGGVELVFAATGNVLLDLRLDTLVTILVSQAQLFLFFSMIGNAVSLLFPFPVRQDTMRGSQLHSKNFLVGMLVLQLFFLSIIPTLICFSGDFAARHFWNVTRLPVGMICSIAFFLFFLWAYRVSLSPLGLLFQRREQSILEKLNAKAD